MAQRTPTQLARQRRVESVIGLLSPFLDVVLYAGERVSRVAGRNDIDPEPPRRLDPSERRARIGARVTERQRTN
jgi:hypothetical protein